MDLATLRKARGLTQMELAEALGFRSKVYISQLETGAVPMTLRIALKIEAWSGGELRAVDLLTGDDADLLKSVANAATPSGVAA